MSLGKSEIDWRPATDSDEMLLRELVMDRGQWPALPQQLRDQLAETQWRAWRAGLKPSSEVFVVQRDTEAVGMIALDRTVERVHVVDLAVRLSARNQGIGSAVLHRLQAGGNTIELWVRKQNPAMRLYERLGFEVIEIDEIDLRLHWTPS